MPLKCIKFVCRDNSTYEEYFCGYESKPSGKILIHSESPMHDSHTLCGAAYDDEACYDYSETTEKINCPDCIAFIKAVKGIKHVEIKHAR